MFASEGLLNTAMNLMGTLCTVSRLAISCCHQEGDLPSARKDESTYSSSITWADGCAYSFASAAPVWAGVLEMAAPSTFGMISKPPSRSAAFIRFTLAVQFAPGETDRML